MPRTSNNDQQRQVYVLVSQGYLYISGGRIFMEIYNAASNILTANINGTPFGANAYSAWYAIVELQRIGA